MNAKAWLIAAGVVAGAAGVFAAAGGFSSALPVELVEITVGPIEEFVDERGKTRLPETCLVTMPINGRIESVALAEGAPVERGQVVARIVPLDLDLTVAEAQAVVDRLKAAIEENRYKAIEETALEQAKQFVRSMADTVKVALTRVESGKDRFDYQEKNLGRIQSLVKSGAQSEDDLDRARLDKLQAGWNLRQDELVLSATESLAAATNLLPAMVEQFMARKTYTEAVLEKQLAEATARLRQVEQEEKRGTMTSPIDGVVLERAIVNERFLSAGTVLLEIGRLDDLEVEVDVLSVDVVDVKPGDRVRIYGPVIGRRLPNGTDHARGTVQKIYPAGFTKISSLGVEEQRVKVIVDFDRDDLAWLRKERDLGVGYRVRVRIITAAKPDALLVPRSALFRGSDGAWNVYAVRDGRARVETVAIRMMNDEVAEVAAGLVAGDVVVRAPESNLADGERVVRADP
jgi:HlyD family secretion protein